MTADTRRECKASVRGTSAWSAPRAPRRSLPSRSGSTLEPEAAGDVALREHSCVSGGECDDRDAVAVRDVRGSGRGVDADRGGVVAHRSFGSRLAAAGGVGAVAGGAVDRCDAGVLDVGDVHVVGRLVDRDGVGAEAGWGGGGGPAAPARV